LTGGDHALTFLLMETREFAQRVLFSTSLEDKLTAVAGLTDEEPGVSIGTPGEPGRPVDLRLRRDGVRAPFPRDAKLIDEEQRGILLHFFANHELLATELMALVLLKFPGAPSEFRQGILRTLKEEQNHTKWYLLRMRECGVEFGDFPLNRFFWDSIAPMETPLDYVTRLSLTFEQANLDYAKHYAGILGQAGDSKTSAILSRIYHDEIAHVGYGLKWFRRWKAAGDSDWEAYKRQLPFPLSPSRGRGNVAFNAEGRRKAGLDDSFIREIEIYSRSKGRTPNVAWFTADAEAAMAHGLDGEGFLPRQDVRVLTHDLEILSAFVCRRDDVILMKRPPTGAHRRKLHDLGFDLPEVEPLDGDGQIPPESLLRKRKINDLRPWAWCPQSAKLLQALNPHRVRERWNEPVRQLFSKAWQVENLGIESFVCRSMEDISRAVCVLREGGHNEILAKAPFGAAGQKNQRFSSTEPEGIPGWVSRMLTNQGAVLLEPWLSRAFDFSVQYELDASGLHHLGFVQLENNRRGQFRACVVRGKFCRGLPAELAKFLMDNRLTFYREELPATLEPLLRAAGYCGPVGIDAFVFRTPDGELRLRSVVEMNPRYTMGRLTWELSRRVAAGRTARFELIKSEAPAKKIRQIEEENPAVLGTGGKMISGCVVLNEPEAVLAVLTVGGD
jgi:uncharacterized ferritin-like protein (DUF455 family)